MKVNDSLQDLKFPENNCLILDEKESYASTGRRYKTLTITVPVQMRSSQVSLASSAPPFGSPPRLKLAAGETGGKGKTRHWLLVAIALASERSSD